jgi:tetratricopeptide (TPR) repeat protein
MGKKTAKSDLSESGGIDRTLCLVMIVKNEEKILRRCFDSMIGYLDYWVICDTGSKDNTREFIKGYFEEKKVPGELHCDEWIHFGHNRTKAIERAKGKADYLVLADADFEMVVKDKNFKNKLTKPAYLVKYEGNLDYRQALLVNSQYDWEYVGVTHEYLQTKGSGRGNEDVTSYIFDGFTFLHKVDGHSRKNKFERDINLLKKALVNDPKNKRYLFYLARSYFDIKCYKKAKTFFEKRISEGGWQEEIYYSKYQRALCMFYENFPFSECVEAFMDAYRYRPSRLEALHDLVRCCRLNRKFKEGFQYGLGGLFKPYPRDVLFVDKAIHEWKFYDEMALCAYFAKERYFSAFLYDRMFREKKYPGKEEERLRENYGFFEPGKTKRNQTLEKKVKEVVFVCSANERQRHTYPSVIVPKYEEYLARKKVKIHKFSEGGGGEGLNQDKIDQIRPCVTVVFGDDALNHFLEKKMRIPFIFFSENKYECSYDFIFSKESPECIVYPTNYQKNHGKIKKRDLHIRKLALRPLINYEEFRGIRKEHSKKKYLVFIGDDDVMLLHSISKKIPGENFLFITNQNIRNHFQLAKNIFVSDVCMEDQEKRKKVYQLSKMVIYCEKRKPFARITAEASVCGVPCLSWKRKGIEESTYGLSNYLDEDSPSHVWVDKIKDILVNEKEYQEKCKRICGYFDYERDLFNFYEILNFFSQS